jgi:DNA-binding MarR family transcriptional regulator
MTTAQPPVPPSPLALDPWARACMDTYARAMRVGEELSKAILAELHEAELTANLPFIVLLGLYVDGPMRPTAIARLSGLTSGGVSGALERMEALGLLTRDFGRVPGDRRGVVVRLTDTGLDAAARISGLVDVVVDRLLRDLCRLAELQDRRNAPGEVTAPVPPVVPAPGPTGPEESPGDEPSVRQRSRANIDIMLRVVRVGLHATRATRERLVESEFAQNVSELALYGLLVHGSLRPSEIATMTGLSSGGVSGLLERLEGLGIVSRDFGMVPGDRRGVVVRLTDKGYRGMLVVIEIRQPLIEALLDELAPFIDARAHSHDVVATAR